MCHYDSQGRGRLTYSRQCKVSGTNFPCRKRRQFITEDDNDLFYGNNLLNHKSHD